MANELERELLLRQIRNPRSETQVGDLRESGRAAMDVIGKLFQMLGPRTENYPDSPLTRRVAEANANLTGYYTVPEVSLSEGGRRPIVRTVAQWLRGLNGPPMRAQAPKVREETFRRQFKDLIDPVTDELKAHPYDVREPFKGSVRVLDFEALGIKPPKDAPSRVRVPARELHNPDEALLRDAARRGGNPRAEAQRIRRANAERGLRGDSTSSALKSDPAYQGEGQPLKGTRSQPGEEFLSLDNTFEEAAAKESKRRAIEKRLLRRGEEIPEDTTIQRRVNVDDPLGGSDDGYAAPRGTTRGGIRTREEDRLIGELDAKYGSRLSAADEARIQRDLDRVQPHPGRGSNEQTIRRNAPPEPGLLARILARGITGIRQNPDTKQVEEFLLKMLGGGGGR